MKTDLKKSQKTTEILFDEASPWITVNIYNTDHKNRLTAHSVKHPDLCRLTDDTEDSGLSFEIAKGRFCFRLIEPYSDERQAAASKFAKKNHKIPAKGGLENANNQRRTNRSRSTWGYTANRYARTC